MPGWGGRRVHRYELCVSVRVWMLGSRSVHPAVPHPFPNLSKDP
jgi:hypothetical protein